MTTNYKNTNWYKQKSYRNTWQLRHKQKTTPTVIRVTLALRAANTTDDYYDDYDEQYCSNQQQYPPYILKATTDQHASCKYTLP